MPIENGKSTNRNSFDDDDEFEAEWLRRHDPANRPDYVDDKLGREVGLFFGGAADTAKLAFKSENVATTAVETGLSLAAGAAFKLAETRLPGLRPAAAIVGTAMATSFAADIALNLKEVGGIMADTWNNRDHYQSNRESFARHGGRFGFDLALTISGGLAGSMLAEKSLLTKSNGFMRLPIFEEGGNYGEMRGARRKLFAADDTRAETFNRAEPTALRLSVTKGDGSSSQRRGNGFVISQDGLAVTNHHVIEGASSILAFDNRGFQFKASVLTSDPQKDLAVLHLHTRDPQTRFTPAPLADRAVKEGERLLLTGHQSSMRSLTVSEGHMMGEAIHKPESSKGSRPSSRNSWWRSDKEPDPELKFFIGVGPRNLGSYYSKSGLSGSAVWGEEGRVVGVHTGRLIGYRRTTFTPAQDIETLLPQALQARAELLKPQS